MRGGTGTPRKSRNVLISCPWPVASTNTREGYVVDTVTNTNTVVTLRKAQCRRQEDAVEVHTRHDTLNRVAQ